MQMNGYNVLTCPGQFSLKHAYTKYLFVSVVNIFKIDEMMNSAVFNKVNMKLFFHIFDR